MRRLLKRVLDIVGALAGLVVFLPVMLVVALLVAVRLGRPVLFRQVRPGINGRYFTLYKFRTMTDAHGVDGHTLSDEKRLTSFGRFLRSTSLDELPELINVLVGDMSLVGPRPLLLQYLDRYTPEQARRHAVKPGITGWAQVNGRNAITWEQKFALDVWYVDNWSIWLDIRVIIMTVWKVITREGITSGRHVTMPEFRGSQTSKEGMP